MKKTFLELFLFSPTRGIPQKRGAQDLPRKKRGSGKMKEDEEKTEKIFDRIPKR